MDNVQQQKSQSAEPKAENETPSVPSTDTINDPEAERLRTENTSLQNTLRMRDASDELTRSLADAGARSPQLLFAAAKDDLQFSDDGKLQNTAARSATSNALFPISSAFKSRICRSTAEPEHSCQRRYSQPKASQK